MTVNGARRFKENNGKSYFVQNSFKSDSAKGKYILTVKENGIYKICYDMFLNVLHFDSIKDAQREVLYSAEFIQTM